MKKKVNLQLKIHNFNLNKRFLTVKVEKRWIAW